MAGQPQVPENVTPTQFFEELLPMGFAAQAAEGGSTPGDFTVQFAVRGEGGGEWVAKIADGKAGGRKKRTGYFAREGRGVQATLLKDRSNEISTLDAEN